MTPRCFASLTETLIRRCKQLAQDCEDVTLVFDGGNTSRANIEALQASPYHFVTSLTVTQHEDLLAVPASKFHSFADPRLAGVTAYRSAKVIWGERRTVVVTNSRRLLDGQLAGINHALRKKRAALRALRRKLARSQLPGAKGKGYSRASLQKHFDTITSGQYVSRFSRFRSANPTAYSVFDSAPIGQRTSACNAGAWASASCAPTTSRGASRTSSWPAAHSIMWSARSSR